MPARLLNTILFACLLATGTRPACAAEKLERYEFLRIEMGVPFRIVLYAADESAANKAAHAAYARIKQLNGVLSDYDPDSELMQLCRSSKPGRPVKMSEDLERVLVAALAMSRKSDGAFDVTVGPVVRLWRIARRKKEMPAGDALADALGRVGWKHVRLDRERHTVELLREGMRIDLGGIAKGFAGDEALKTLKTHGVTRALIDGSGDIVAGDPPPGNNGWTVDVAGSNSKTLEGAPKPTGGVPRDRLLLSNSAVATSGDAFQFVEIDGQRYSHIIDPQTGFGLTESSSVTVIAETGMAADSLASAVSVLGAERGLKLVEECEGCAALVVILRDGEPQRRQTSSFVKFISGD